MAHIPQLSLWEKLDFLFVGLSIAKTALVAAILGPFRGDNGPRTLFLHICYAVARTFTGRLSTRQMQYLDPPTEKVYNQVANSLNFQPETVTLPHDTLGHWIGDKNAQSVIIYLPGNDDYAYP